MALSGGIYRLLRGFRGMNVRPTAAKTALRVHNLVLVGM